VRRRRRSAPPRAAPSSAWAMTASRSHPELRSARSRRGSAATGAAGRVPRLRPGASHRPPVGGAGSGGGTRLTDWTGVLDVALAGVAGAALGGLFRHIRYLNRPSSLTRKAWSGWRYVAAGAVAGAAALLLAKRAAWPVPDWDWILVASLGGAVGVGELASRYRDEPIKAILSIPAAVYVLLNAAAAVPALLLGRHFGMWEAAEEPVAWAQVLSAGLGAMVLLRSSVFQIRVGSGEARQDVGVGPSSFLQSVLDAADREVDRLRAQERAWAVCRVMENASSRQVLAVLPSYLPALMQNLGQNERAAFEKDIEDLRCGDASDLVKARRFVLRAMTLTGEKVLQAAVDSLDAELLVAAEATSDAAAGAKDAARGAKVSTEGALAAAGRAADAAHATGAPPAVAEAMAAAKERAAAADAAAAETLDRAQETAEAAEATAEVAERGVRAQPGSAPPPDRRPSDLDRAA
jgi:hypothetical protein